MPYTQKNIKNALQTLLVWNISNSDTLFTITTGEGAMFPTNNTSLVLEQFNTSWACFKREIVNLVWKSWDILTVVRAYEGSVQDDTILPKTITQNALSFNLDQGIVKISQYITAKIFDDLENEVVLVRTELWADILKAVQKQNVVYGASSTGSDSYAITLSPAPDSYTAGMTLRFLADVANTGVATLKANWLWEKTIKKSNDQDLASGDIEANQIVEVVYNSVDDVWEMTSQVASVYIPVVDRVKFWGDGSDWALNISSGTTTLALSSNQIVKNYDSINISWSAILEVTWVTGNNGAIAYIRCKWDFTMSAGTVRMNAQWWVGGAGGIAASGLWQVGSDGYSTSWIPNYYSKGGIPGVSTTVGGVAINSPGYVWFFASIKEKVSKIAWWSGGGGGNAATNVWTGGGAGGRGGGLIIIEVWGAINFAAGTIQANGGVGSQWSAGSGRGGSGGGGAGWSIYIIYNTLTSTVGTIQANGWAGGNGITGGSAGFTEGGGGSGGSGFLASIWGDGGIGGVTASSGTSNAFGTGGAGGTSVGADAGGGGGGWAGWYYLVEKNTELA